MDTHTFIREHTRRAMMAEAARVEDQIKTFLRMGYELDELELVRTGHWTRGETQVNCVPKSALKHP